MFPTRRHRHTDGSQRSQLLAPLIVALADAPTNLTVAPSGAAGATASATRRAPRYTQPAPIPITPSTSEVTMNTTRRLGATVVAIAVLALAPAFSGNAWARQDPGDPAPATTSHARTYPYCPLERIGRQLVRCDNLTGNGALAPLAVPEQK